MASGSKSRDPEGFRSLQPPPTPPSEIDRISTSATQTTLGHTRRNLDGARDPRICDRPRRGRRRRTAGPSPFVVAAVGTVVVMLAAQAPSSVSASRELLYNRPLPGDAMPLRQPSFDWAPRGPGTIKQHRTAAAGKLHSHTGGATSAKLQKAETSQQYADGTDKAPLTQPGSPSDAPSKIESEDLIMAMEIEKGHHPYIIGKSEDRVLTAMMQKKLAKDAKFAAKQAERAHAASVNLEAEIITNDANLQQDVARSVADDTTMLGQEKQDGSSQEQAEQRDTVAGDVEQRDGVRFLARQPIPFAGDGKGTGRSARRYSSFAARRSGLIQLESDDAEGPSQGQAKIVLSQRPSPDVQDLSGGNQWLGRSEVSVPVQEETAAGPRQGLQPAELKRLQDDNRMAALQQAEAAAKEANDESDAVNAGRRADDSEDPSEEWD